MLSWCFSPCCVLFWKGVCLLSHLKAIIFRKQQYLMSGNISIKQKSGRMVELISWQTVDPCLNALQQKYIFSFKNAFGKYDCILQTRMNAWDVLWLRFRRSWWKAFYHNNLTCLGAGLFVFYIGGYVIWNETCKKAEFPEKVDFVKRLSSFFCTRTRFHCVQL